MGMIEEKLLLSSLIAVEAEDRWEYFANLSRDNYQAVPHYIPFKAISSKMNMK
jgi:hypothetical protein